MKNKGLLFLCCFACLFAKATNLPDTLFIRRDHYTFFIIPQGLRYGILLNRQHIEAISPHAQAGIRFAKGAERPRLPANAKGILKQEESLLQLAVENEQSMKARLSVFFDTNYVALKLQPFISNQVDSLFTIDFCTAAASPAYGLGDHGGYGDNMAIRNFIEDDFGNRDNGHRFISTFSIFPQNQFAQVLFEKRTKRVAISDRENRLGAVGVKEAKIYYLLGRPRTIYSSYKQLKIQEGYPDIKPKYRFFELGYEAFGSLGWNTFQHSVQEDLDHYLKNGFGPKWAVVGSGFWKGERKNPSEGSTTSFGIWDDLKEGGRKDGLPSPRYPDVKGFKKFFAERGIDLLVGLRINFKAPRQYQGNFYEANDGPFTLQGLDSSYFVTDAAMNPETYKVVFPQGNVFLLNGGNRRAIDWYVRGADKWGVKGFKEDLMLLDGAKLNNDAKVDEVNRALIDKEYLLMARNGAYAVPGDILRLEDTQYGHDQDRPLINGLNYAASGVSAVYLDIVAGKYLKLPLTNDQELYFARNAMLAAVSPVMAMGLGPWNITNTHYKDAVKKAADWHTQYAPYLYSAAVKSFKEGYPYTMTPLPIAFPTDTNTYYLAGKEHRQYAWMLGESLLATPVYGNDYATATSRDVYLPAGRWIDFEKGTVFNGPCTLQEYEFPTDKLPLFVGGDGILVRKQGDAFYADIYPVSERAFLYDFYFPDGSGKSTVNKRGKGIIKENVRVKDLATNKEVELEAKHKNLGWSFRLLPGHRYEIYE